LAEKYHVSLGTVRNWIEAAQSKGIGVTLHYKNGKPYVANTASNILTIELLVEGGRKYRPHRTFKTLTPRPEFYQLYSQAQIHDVITNLEVRREIPRQYNYFDGGASSWDEYIQRIDRENAPSNLTMTRELLAKNESYVDGLIEQYRRVNIIDIGPGNALPVRILLANLIEESRLGRYIAIDISPEMLRIAKKNIERWFGERVTFEGYELDINRERFANILVEDHTQTPSKPTCNLILFLGGTIQNFRKRDVPLQVINDSMGPNDFLLHTQKLDSTATRSHFDFSTQPGEQALPPIHSLVVDLLNIDPTLYDLELGYDAQKRERYERIRFKTSLSIEFDLQGGKRLFTINKGEALLLWRASQDSAMDVINLFDRNDFCLLQTSQTEDGEYILTISRVKRDWVHLRKRTK
jgi:SAM-dependent methyltransferase